MGMWEGVMYGAVSGIIFVFIIDYIRMMVKFGGIARFAAFMKLDRETKTVIRKWPKEERIAFLDKTLNLLQEGSEE